MASWETVVQNPLGHCKISERNTVVRWKEANKQELVPVWAWCTCQGTTPSKIKKHAGTSMLSSPAVLCPVLEKARYRLTSWALTQTASNWQPAGCWWENKREPEHFFYLKLWTTKEQILADNTEINDKKCENKCESQDEKHQTDSVTVFTVLVALAMQQVWSGQYGSLAQDLWHKFKKDSSHVRTKPEALTGLLTWG